MARWLIPSNDETDASDERILARESAAMTVSRAEIEARMVKNHGLTPEEAKARMDEGLKSCSLEQDGDKISLPLPKPKPNFN